jgi:TRAP-type C4-dicarboxylate transport system substrate-binding protein
VALVGTFVPAMNMLAMPFLFRSVDHLQKVLDGPIGSEYWAASRLTDLSAWRLRFQAGDLQQRQADPLYRRRRGLASLQQSELMSDMIKALGAEPIELPMDRCLPDLPPS